VSYGSISRRLAHFSDVDEPWIALMATLKLVSCLPNQGYFFRRDLGSRAVAEIGGKNLQLP
jgi:hypothetical protein